MRAEMPEPPYYAVIFTSKLAPSTEGYTEAGDRMVELAKGQPGFLGIESVRDASGDGITVSYWCSLEAIANWKKHAEHLVAQRLGKEKWYQSFALRIARVERASTFPVEGHP